MCISDYQIGRLIRHAVSSWNTTGAVGTTYLPNPSRIGLIVTPSAAALLSTALTILTFDTGVVYVRQGASTTPITLLLKDIGDFVQRGFVITAVGTAHAGVTTELILPPELLAAGLAKFRPNY